MIILFGVFFFFLKGKEKMMAIKSKVMKMGICKSVCYLHRQEEA